MARRKPFVVEDIDDTAIYTWFERDRRHVELRHVDSDKTIVQWWDDDVDEAIEDGFLDASDFHGSAYEYALEHGLIEEE